MNCHCLPYKRWIYAPLLHFRPTVLAKASLNIQEAESHLPCQSYQRHQKPPPAWSQGVCRCTWQLRGLRVMVTRVWVSVASEGAFSSLPLSAFCPLPTQQRVANCFPCAGALSALYSSSASSALKNRVVFQLRSVGIPEFRIWSVLAAW